MKGFPRGCCKDCKAMRIVTQHCKMVAEAIGVPQQLASYIMLDIAIIF